MKENTTTLFKHQEELAPNMINWVRLWLAERLGYNPHPLLVMTVFDRMMKGEMVIVRQ
jgi:hypothetical protein